MTAQEARYRITFATREAMRFTSHLDLVRAWERTLRRARLPLAYSTGFHPHPHLQIGAALPVGCTAQAELAEVWLEEELAPSAVLDALCRAAPPGLVFRHLEPCPPGKPHFEVEIVAGDYSAEPVAGSLPADLAARIAQAMLAPALVRQRRGKRYDLRPLILDLKARAGPPSLLWMRLKLQPGQTGRPEEVAAALGLEELSLAYCRERLVLLDPSGLLHGSDELPGETGERDRGGRLGGRG